MKQIKRVKIQGLKDRNTSYDLGPVTVLVGGSFSGKTAVLDAIRLGLLGWHPKLGRRPADVMKLAGGLLRVELEFDDKTIVREWQTVKGVARYSGPDKPLVPALALDYREFTAMTGRERTQYVFRQVGGGDAESVLKRLKLIQTETPEMVRALDATLADALKLWTEAKEQDVSLPDWIDALTADLKDRKKLADAAIKQMAGLTAGAEQLRQGPPPQNVESQLKAARDEWAKQKAELADLERTVRESATRKNRIATLKAATNLPFETGDLSRLEAERQAHGEAGAALPKPDVSTAKTAVQRLKWEAEQATNWVKEKDGEIRQLKTQRDDVGTLDRCPFCKSAKKGWQEHLIADYDQKIAQAQALKEGHQKKADAATRKLVEATNALVAEETKLEAIEAHAKAGEMVERKLVAMRMAERTHAESLATLRELERQEAELKGDEGQRMEQLETRLKANQEELLALDLQQKRWVAAKAEEAQQLKAKAQMDAQSATSEVLKRVLADLTALQAELVNAGIGGLMAAANQFTQGILRYPMAFEAGELGYWKGRQWVSHECFSGTEEALAYVAMSVALCQRGGPSIVLLDELGIMDPATRQKVVERMCQLVDSGVIDQAIMCDSNSVPMPPGVTRIEVAP